MVNYMLYVFTKHTHTHTQNQVRKLIIFFVALLCAKITSQKIYEPQDNILKYKKVYTQKTLLPATNPTTRSFPVVER